MILRAKSARFSNLRYTRNECASAGCSARLADDIDAEGVRVVQQTRLGGEVDNTKQIVPYMPRAKNGVGRRYKKRRTSPASAIEVEQIEEEGVEELVVVEGETEEVAEIAIVEFGEDVVMWVLDHVFEKVWAERDWQAYRFVRYATMSSVVVREWKREGGVEGIGPHWWAVRKMWDEFRLAGWEKEYTACAPFGQWERLRCSDCWGTASVCECTRECACGNVSKWSWGFIGGLCACADAPGVVCEAKTILDA